MSGADLLIHELTRRQHGLVTRTQLLEGGLSASTVDYRIKSGRLRPIHRGVYQVGPLEAPRYREMAAALACGPGAIVSHRSAAGLWQMLPPPGRDAPVDVIIRTDERRKRPGIRMHRPGGVEPGEIAELEGIPVTSPVRTLFDLSSAVHPRDLERALARAEREGLANRFQLVEQADRWCGRVGIPALRALLQAEGAPALTRSEAEDRLLELLEESSLPRPETNVAVQGHEVDFFWRTERVAVEVDGFAYHSSTDRFERDRLRDAELSASGVQVVRLTWRQLVKEPKAVLVRLAQTLARAGC